MRPGWGWRCTYAIAESVAKSCDAGGENIQ